MKQICLPLLLIILLLTSCIKELEVDGAFVQARSGMSVILANDGRNIEGALFETAAATGKYPLELYQNSVIYLYKDNVFFDTLKCPPDSNIFKGNREIEVGNYSAKAILAVGDTLFSYTSVPDIVEITDWHITPIYAWDEEGWPYSRIELTIPNKTNKLCYYELILFYSGYNDLEIPDTNYANISINEIERQLKICPLLEKQTDPVLLRENLRSVALFSNELMKGDDYKLKCDFRASHSVGSVNNGLWFPSGVGDVYIVLRAVSKEYYEFVRSVDFYESGRFPDLFEEPIYYNVYSNVKNGAGAVYGYSSSMIGPIDTLYKFY